jgi:hypothetical protein
LIGVEWISTRPGGDRALPHIHKFGGPRNPPVHHFLDGFQVTDMSRKELFKILTIYTDAICQKDLTSIPIARNVRVTWNGNLTKLGVSPVWETPGRLRIPYRRALVDHESGAALLRCTVTNEVVQRGATAEEIMNPTPGKWWWLALRLKIESGFITEIEEIISDVGFPGTPASTMTIPDRIWDAIVPEEQRSTRDELNRIADDYFSTVSGAIAWHDAPFHPECNRYENGAPTTNAVFIPGSVGTGLLSPTLQGLVVTNRRFYVVDVALGVVAAIAKFTPPSRSTNITQGAVSAVIFEEFKIQDGLIRHIEAFFCVAGQEYSNWGTGPGAGPRDVPTDA